MKLICILARVVRDFKAKIIDEETREYAMERPIGIYLEGTVYAKNGDLGHNDFTNAFTEFVESKGWHFGGGSFQINYDGEKIDDID